MAKKRFGHVTAASKTRIRLFRDRVRIRVMDSFGVVVRVRLGIRVYAKPFCSAAKP